MEVVAFDAETGLEIWKHSRSAFKQSPFLAIDRSGTTIAFAADNNDRTIFVNLPSGEICGYCAPATIAFEPRARRFVARRNDDAGLAVFRHGDEEPFVMLGNDLDPQPFSPCFSDDGRLIAFGTTEGSVLLCDLASIESFLSKLGFPTW
jgi:hypothetical protein